MRSVGVRLVEVRIGDLGDPGCLDSWIGPEVIVGVGPVEVQDRLDLGELRGCLRHAVDPGDAATGVRSGADSSLEEAVALTSGAGPEEASLQPAVERAPRGLGASLGAAEVVGVPG